MSTPAEKPLRPTTRVYATEQNKTRSNAFATPRADDSYAVAELLRRQASMRRVLALAQQHF